MSARDFKQKADYATMNGGVNKRLTILLFLAALVALAFWSTSRYPDLTIKGAAAPNLVLDGLGFDVVYPVHPDDAFLLKVFKRTVNWLDTNKKGMAFGLVIAAALGAALSTTCRKSFHSLLPNTAAGVVLGAPMGLCVNCAAPIGAGLHRSGSRLETTMALVLASPTLNVVVLSILFTMLPWHLALLKLLFTLLLLFAGVPVLARSLPDEQPRSSLSTADFPTCESPSAEGWGQALLASGKLFFSTLWKLSLTLVPLMIVGGALGSLFVSLFPFGALASLSKTVNPVTLVLVALLGTFLPVPMSFDVIVCGLLYHSGVPVPYVAVLLFTLGSFSVYSYTVFEQAVSGKVARALFFLVAGLGVLSGYVGDFADNHYRQHVDQLLKVALQEELARSVPTRSTPELDLGRTYSQLQNSMKESPGSWELVIDRPDFFVERRVLNTPEGSVGEELFTVRSAASLGLKTSTVLSYQEQLSIPMLTNRAIAAADIHDDGWVDIVVANDTEIGGVSFFTNVGGRFEKQRVELGPHATEFIPALALVDWDNDNDPDLFYCTITGEVSVILNDSGEWGNRIELPALDGAFVNALGFGDIDKDGKLEAVLGTWVHRTLDVQSDRGKNYILKQDPDGPYLTPLKGRGGNTNSVLITDFNNDSFPDLIVANDFAHPDEFYLGSAQGFDLPLGPEVVGPCPEWNMNLDSADLNGDGVLEILALNIAFPTDARGRLVEAQSQRPHELLEPESLRAYEYLLRAGELHERVRTIQNAREGLDGQFLQGSDLREYLYDALLSRSWRGDKPEEWQPFIPADDQLTQSHFRRVFPPAPQKESQETKYELLRGQRTHSSLFRWDQEQGRFQDSAEQWNLLTTFWSWNGRFQDFDLDGFQDLYIVTGTFQERLLTPNLLYMGQAKNTFELDKESRTADYTPTACATYLDFDNDGDVDIVTSPPNSPLRVFENRQQTNKAVLVSLTDLAGESGSFGSRVVAHHDGRKQLREHKLSGGYNSFNPSVMLFGLGATSRIDLLEVFWNHGGKSTLDKALESGYHYRIVRRAQTP